MQRHGWTLLFHRCVVEQLNKLSVAAARAQQADPAGYRTNANYKLLVAASRLILDTVPRNPASVDYRLGNTLGADHRHWRRAKIGRRFRVFFRFDTRSKTIVFAWINDQQTLRSSGSKSDPYRVFEQMLRRGNPPDDWPSLLAASLLNKPPLDQD